MISQHYPLWLPISGQLSEMREHILLYPLIFSVKKIGRITIKYATYTITFIKKFNHLFTILLVRQRYWLLYWPTLYLITLKTKISTLKYNDRISYLIWQLVLTFGTIL